MSYNLSGMKRRCPPALIACQSAAPLQGHLVRHCVNAARSVEQHHGSRETPLISPTHHFLPPPGPPAATPTPPSLPSLSVTPTYCTCEPSVRLPRRLIAASPPTTPPGPRYCSTAAERGRDRYDQQLKWRGGKHSM